MNEVENLNVKKAQIIRLIKNEITDMLTDDGELIARSFKAEVEGVHDIVCNKEADDEVTLFTVFTDTAESECKTNMTLYKCSN
jgi:hypothetical protein